MSDSPSTTSTAAAAGIDRTKLLIEFGPLLLFFLANFAGRRLVGKEAIFWATGTFMAATLAAMLLSRWRYGKIAPMLWVNGVIITVFGALTIFLKNDMFIKLKPTIVNLIFATLLFSGLAFRRNLLKLVFEAGFPALPDAVWRTLTIRWGFFFILLAALNEYVWRTQSTDFWVNFKVWGVLPITFAFTLLQMPLILKHSSHQKD